MTQGKIKQALEQCQQFAQHNPTNLQAWYILSDLFLRCNMTAQALVSINKAQILDNSQPQIQILKIQCLLLNGDPSQALIIANALFDKKPVLMGKDWLSLGFNFHQLNVIKSAHHCFEKAIEIEPNNSQYRFNLATSLRNFGELEQAHIDFNKVIALNSRDWDAYLARSEVKKATKDCNNIKQLTLLLKSNTIDTQAQIKLNFAKAKEQEDCHHYSDSYSSLKKANNFRNSLTKYDVEHDIKAMQCIIDTYSIDLTIKQTSGCSNDEPIFIVGLPRTGTTLLERIIGQHCDVFSAGELNNFPANLTRQLTENTEEKITSKLDLIKRSAELNFENLGQQYINSTKLLTGNSARFIDKMPLNFLYVGLIQKALPKAKIIHLTRNPMATCYAIYKTNFNQAYPFSYDLNNLAKYYIAYSNLMKHWKQANPQNFLEVSYEQLVNSTEEIGRKVFNFLELKWQVDYVNLENNKQASSTASSAQIRGKIYNSSIDLWKNYKSQLETLREQLEQAGIYSDKC